MIRRTKRLILLFTAGLLLALPQTPIQSYAAVTTDLDRLNAAYGESFQTGQYLTREEFCVVIARAFMSGNADPALLPFDDAAFIKPENLPHIAALYQRGVLSGSADNGKLHMNPNGKITRQEAFTLLGKVLKKTSDYTPAFTDADRIAPWAYGYISWFAEKKLVLGYTDGRLGPSDTMTAEQLAVLVYKTLAYKQRENITVSTYFGTGSRGLVDGGKSTARFTLPYGLTFDKDGNLTVMDTYNNAIRTIKSGKSETTTGTIKAYDDNRFAKGYYLDGSLTDALLNRPTSAVCNSKGELIFADSANHVIRYISGSYVYTYAGTAKGYSDGAPKEAKFNTPTALAIDSNDIIYVADTLNNCIRKIDPKGVVTTIAGIPGKSGFSDGIASAALFLEPSGIAVSGDGKTIYVSDTCNHRIRKIEDGVVTSLAGTTTGNDEDGYPLGGYNDGAASLAMFSSPRGLTLADGVLIIADSGNHMIRALTTDGGVTTLAGTGEPGDKSGAASEAAFDHPSGVCWYRGNLYIADTNNNKIKSMPFGANVIGGPAGR